MCPRPSFPEVRVATGKGLTNEMQAEVVGRPSGKCLQRGAASTGIISFPLALTLPPAWKVEVMLEVEQSCCDHKEAQRGWGEGHRSWGLSAPRSCQTSPTLPTSSLGIT